MRPTLLLAGLAPFAIAAFAAAPPHATDAARPAERPDPGCGDRVREDATKLLEAMGVAPSDLTRRFIQASRALPNVGPRTLYVDREAGAWYSKHEREACPEPVRDRLTEREFNADFYYNTGYGSPLAYSRAIEVLTDAAGFDSFEGTRVMDFGYGGIGHLRMMASLGADVIGVEISPILRAYYSDPSDTGEIDAAEPGGKPGRLTLAHGRWPGEESVATAVAQHAPLDLIISKNTLKKGYVRPDREADPRFLVDLGVSDEQFLRALHDALRPGGVVLIYNLSPAPSKESEPFKPHTDGRCPFTLQEWVAAGFEVIVLDGEDHAAAREMAFILGWNPDLAKLDADLFTLYTIVRRKPAP